MIRYTVVVYNYFKLILNNSLTQAYRIKYCSLIAVCGIKCRNRLRSRCRRLHLAAAAVIQLLLIVVESRALHISTQSKTTE